MKDRAEQKRQTAALLRRVGRIAARSTAYAAVVAVAAWGIYEGHRFLTTSPSLALESIDIVGNDRASAYELERMLGVARGDNLLLADVSAAEQGLLEHPWVAKAEVRRRFPQGLVIEVLEREAVALVDLGHLYLVDRDGEVFKRAMPGDPLDLPVVTGLAREEWSERSGEAREKIGEVLDVLEVFAKSGIGSRQAVSELHVDETEGFTLYLGDRGMAVKLGRGELAAKLARLEQVVAFAEGRGERLRLVRLDNRTRPGWIAARLSQGGERLQASLRGPGSNGAKGG